MNGPADPFAPARRIKGRFVNASGYAQNGVLLVLKWFATRKPGLWPKHIANSAPAAPLAHRHDESIRVTVIGHATVLIQVAGMNILTDPVWAKWAGPLPGFGVKRARPPAMTSRGSRAENEEETPLPRLRRPVGCKIATHTSSSSA